MHLDIPFILGILVLLFISIMFAKLWNKIANLIGGKIRMLFINLWEAIKG